MTQPKRIPRKAKKGKKYVKRFNPNTNESIWWGKIMTLSLIWMSDMLHDCHFRRNTRGSRQYVNIMVRHGLMKRPTKPRNEVVITHEQEQRIRERICDNVDNFLNERNKEHKCHAKINISTICNAVSSRTTRRTDQR